MADQKITQLTALAAIPDDADILAIVDDVAGTPVTKKITVANLLAGAGGVSNIVRVRHSSNVTLTSGATYYIITLDTESFDTGNDFNTGTYKYTCPSDGKYLVIAQMICAAVADAIEVAIYKNTTIVSSSTREATTNNTNSRNLPYTHADIISCSANDTLDIRCNCVSGPSQVILASATQSFVIFAKLA